MKARGRQPRVESRCVLRIDPELHDALKRAVREMVASLEECPVHKQAAPGPSFAGCQLATARMQRAAAVVGGHPERAPGFDGLRRGTMGDMP
jgi:hypothetical protein